MNICPTCRLPVSFAVTSLGATVPARDLRTAVLAAKVYRKALEAAPMEHVARAELLSQLDDQIEYLEDAND